MKCNDFINEVYAGVKERLENSGEDVRVELGDAKGINRSGVTLHVVKDSVGSVFYLEQLEASHSVEGAVDFITQTCFPSEETAEEIQFVKDSILDVEFVKKSVIPALVNTAKNQHNLEEIVSREFFDLSLVYKVDAGTDADGTHFTVTMTRALLNNLGITEGELWECAWKNVRPQHDSVVNTIRKMCECDLPDDLIPMQVITTSDALWGGALMLHDGILQEVADLFESDLVIIPSSINEIIAIPYDDTCVDLQSVEGMIMEVNQSVVSDNEILSYSAYWYDRAKHTLNCEGFAEVNLKIA